MQAWRWIEVRLSDRFPGLMLWHSVAVMVAVFAAKALLYWLAPGPIYSVLAGPSWDMAAWIALLALLLRWMRV
ncbi:hypothetical protein C2U29_19545 [Aeromonas veronii]|jgi:hypothetical protein|nr:hypothetical protein C2U29_19545 [Aeromonas veronii]